MRLKIFISQSHTLGRCPSCNEIASLKKSKSRKFYEKFVKLFYFRYYSCHKCGWRGARFRYKIAKNGFKVILIYLIIIFAAIFIVRFILSKLF